MLARTEAAAVEPPLEQVTEPEEEVITPEVVSVESSTPEATTAVVPATKSENKVKAGVLSGIGATIMSALSSL